ncbi:8479_t:CDS:2, partial [Funneliformis geosporum]
MREKNNFLTEREEKSRGTSISPEYFQPEPFVGLTLSNKPKNYPENELEIVLNFCLTIDSEPNLSLFRDFEEIIEEYSQDKTINWSKSALALLKGEVESVLSYPEPQETSQQVKPLYLPFASDPSQTHILKKIFRDFVQSTLCIDGPPGTGKSQLICNLLSNALAYQKKVLVVCEKEVALKVIADKLSSIGLNPSLIKISKLDQTPQIYQEILSHLENNQQVK